MPTGPGSLEWRPDVEELVSSSVAAGLGSWPRRDAVRAAAIDPDLADTAAFCDRYGVALADSANCVVIAGRRGQSTSFGVCVVLATSRADVNGVVRKLLGARKASFAPVEDVVARTGMEYGGITPIGMPADWPVFVDRAVTDRDVVVIGSGLRRSKLALPGAVIGDLPGAHVVDGLALVT